MPLRPWNHLPIADCGEPLVVLPPALLRLEPHPYQALGAPYGAGGGGPFQLRQQVVNRLLQAQHHLQQHRPGLRLAIFDGWRPLAVQVFMVEHAIVETCRERGIDPAQEGPQRDAVVAEVGRFWAPPNADLGAPPPHSTGGAVDLTLADQASCQQLAMGSAIDTIGPVSEPDHWLQQAEAIVDDRARERFLQWHQHRCWLREAMAHAGFSQHPNEWWHFSWGDQLWAWRQGQSQAHYGRMDVAGT
jgi:D-alanyl-D-alanine dipeptidase